MAKWFYGLASLIALNIGIYMFEHNFIIAWVAMGIGVFFGTMGFVMNEKEAKKNG